MKILLDIKDEKASHLLEILKDLSYVKASKLTPYKANILKDVKKAAKQMKLIQSGKLKARNAKEVINEL